MPLVGEKIETTNDNFGDMARRNCLLVDKTLMIKEFLDGKKISLITRPRRFGKTLNLSMLQHFFASKVNGNNTEGLFDKFEIAKVDNGEFLKQHQGQYPVIFVTFKDIKESSYQAAVNQIKSLIKELYRQHEELLDLSKISDTNKTEFKKYLDGSVNNEELQQALKFLSEFLKMAYCKEVIILIDEYDAPLTKAYEYKFLHQLSDFMCNMFSAALKGNGYLEKGLMTGILRVSQSSMLSGLNNLEIYTVLDKDYEPYFGFIEEEVKELVQITHSGQILEGIREFYNGYKIGDMVIYNPWSVMKYFDKKRLAPHWVLTANDQLLKHILLNSDDEAKKKLGDLIQGKAVEGEIDVNLRYEDLIEKSSTLWTLLLFGGYLTVESKKEKGSRFICQLKIPNAEVLQQYIEVFSDWLKEDMGPRYDSFLKSLVDGKVEEFTKGLGDYLMQSLSFRDVGGDKKSERFYHGFTTGLIASLRDTHHLYSNRESGLGIFDVMLVPKSQNNPISIILEFKHAKTHNNSEKEAKTALEQIEQLKYDTELDKYPYIKKILKIGLAFCEKSVKSAYKEEDLPMSFSSNLLYNNNSEGKAVIATTVSDLEKENLILIQDKSCIEKKNNRKKRKLVIEAPEKELSDKIPMLLQARTSSLPNYQTFSLFGSSSNTNNYPVAMTTDSASSATLAIGINPSPELKQNKP